MGSGPHCFPTSAKWDLSSLIFKSTYCVPGTVLGTSDANRTQELPEVGAVTTPFYVATDQIIIKKSETCPQYVSFDQGLCQIIIQGRRCERWMAGPLGVGAPHSLPCPSLPGGHQSSGSVPAPSRRPWSHRALTVTHGGSRTVRGTHTPSHSR